MSGIFGEEKIQEIRDRTNLSELVASYLSLKKAGRNFVGLCPFHQEKSPSFNVNAERQIFKCFGCDAGGDVFDFLMRIEGLSFPEAVRRLAERCGVVIDEKPPTPEEERRKREREHLLRINEVACEFYQRQLLEEPAGEAARRYLKARGYDRAAAETFRLGYAPDGWDGLTRHLADKGFEQETVRLLGLVREGKDGRSDYDLLRRRLIIPILGLHGEVVAFGGRVLDASMPKYINSPESPVYHKSRVLFGLFQGRQAMRQTGDAIVVEGYFDQMALWRAGHANAVASCGTALTEDHAELLKRYARRVLLLFDADKAGQAATWRGMDVLLKAGLETRVVTLAAGEDPDSFLAKQGQEAFAQRLHQSRPVLEAFLDHALAQEEASVEGRVRAAREVAERVTLLPDAMARDLYYKQLAERTGIDEALLRRQTRPAPRPAAPAPAEFQPPPPPEPPAEEAYGQESLAPFRGEVPRHGSRVAAAVTATAPSRARQGSADKAQRMLLRLMLASAGDRQQVAEEGVEQCFLDPALIALAQRLLALPMREGQIEIAELEPGLSGVELALLRELAPPADDPLAEGAERIRQDCHQAVTRERGRQRRQELLARLPQVTDPVELAEIQRELVRLKKLA